MYPSNTLTIDAHIKLLKKCHIYTQFSKEEWNLHGRPGKAHWAAWENSLRTLGDVSGQEISNTDCDLG